MTTFARWKLARATLCFWLLSTQGGRAPDGAVTLITVAQHGGVRGSRLCPAVRDSGRVKATYGDIPIGRAPHHQFATA